MSRVGSFVLHAAALTAALLFLSAASADAAGQSRGGQSRGGQSRGMSGASYRGSSYRGGSYNGAAYRGGSYYRGGAYSGAYRGGYDRGAYRGGSYYRGGYDRGGYFYPGIGIGIGLGLGSLGGGYVYDNSPTYIVAAPPAGDPGGYPAPTVINQDEPPPPAQPADVAMIRVHVPADADLWFDGSPTAQRGTIRDFASPQLTPGKEYSYEIRARWTEGGVPVEKGRRVVVHANDKVGVDFNQPESVTAPTPVPGK